MSSMSNYRIDGGYSHPGFANGAVSGMVELADPSILVTDASLSTAEDIIAVVESFWEATAPYYPPFVVIAKDIDERALGDLVGMHMRGLPLYVVKAPGYGGRCKETLIDVATVIGGFVVPEKPGAERGRIAPGEIGRANVVRMSAESTWIYGGDGTDRAVKERMVAIKREIETASSSFEREELQERLLALVG